MNKYPFYLSLILTISAILQTVLASLDDGPQSKNRQQLENGDDEIKQIKGNIIDQNQAHESHLNKESSVIFFIFISLTIGGLLKHVNKRLPVAYTSMLFLVGYLGGEYHKNLGQLGQAIKSVSSIDPHGILIIFLPVMIFQSGYNTDWHIFRRQFGQILILALPCVIVGSIMIMVFIQFLYTEGEYTLSGSFLLGSLLSWTDTVAIGAILQEIGVPKRLNSLIKGESLMNDITCVALYKVVRENVRESITSFWGSFQYFMVASFGGIIIGIIFGIITSFWIKKIFNDEIHAVNIVLLSCYLIYFFGQNFSLFGFPLNGIIPLVSFGLFMSASGKKRIASQADQAFKQFWTYITFCAETVIFILAGVIVAITFNSEETSGLKNSDYYKLFLIYVFTILARFCSISIFMSPLQRLGYGLTRKEVYVLAYGGLKGAVGISIALIVSHDTHFDEQMRTLILFDISGNALLHLIINGLSIKFLVQYLRVAPNSQLKDKLFMDYLEKDFKQDFEEQIVELKQNKYLKNADWENEVLVFSGAKKQEEYIQQLDKKIQENELLKEEQKNDNFENQKDEENQQKQEKKQSNFQSDDDDEDDDQVLLSKLDEETLIFIRNIFLKRLKSAIWDLYEKNQCTGESYLRLLECFDWDLDVDTTQMNNWMYLKRQFGEEYIHFYSKLRNWTIIGGWAKRQLFQHISGIFDMVHTYIEAHKIVETSLLTIKQDEKFIQHILSEAEENQSSAKKYLDDFLDISFPDVSQQIRTKKVAFTILEYQKDIIKEKSAQGQLDEKEFFSLKKKIDQNIITINNLIPSWTELKFDDFIKSQPLFQLFSQHIQDKTKFSQLINEATEARFDPDQYAFKQGDRASFIFVIMRGGGTENYKNELGKFSVKRGVGHVLPIQQLLNSNNKYQTADCMMITRQISIQKLQQHVKCHHEVEHHIMRESLPYLCKIHYSQFSPLSQLDIDKIEDIISKTVVKRYKKNSFIQIQGGGILAKGEIQFSLPSEQIGSSENVQQQHQEQEDSFLRQSKMSEINTYEQDAKLRKNLQSEQDLIPEKLISSYSIIHPNATYYTFIVKKTSIIFEFQNSEEIKLIILALKKQKANIFQPSSTLKIHKKNV